MPSDPVNLKVVVVGDEAVGKTSLLITYTTNEFPTDYVPTVFDNYTATATIEGALVNIGLWDTAGNEDYDRLRPLSYPQTDVFLVCYSAAQPSSFEHVASRWMPELAHHEPNRPVVLVACKSDLRSGGPGAISTADGKKMAEKIGAAAFVECSSQVKGVKEVFNAAVAAGMKRDCDHYGASYANTKSCSECHTNYEEALKGHTEALQSQKDRHRQASGSPAPSQNSEIACTLRKIAAIHRQQGEYGEALRVLRSSFAWLGSPQRPIDINSSFSTCRCVGDQTCRSPYHKPGGQNGELPDVPLMLDSMALVHYRQGDLEETLHCLEEARQIRMHVYGERSEQVADNSYNIGLLHASHGNPLMGVGCFQACAKTYARLYGKGDDRTKDALRREKALL